MQAEGTEKNCSHPQSFLNNSVTRKSHCLHEYGSDIPEKGDYAGTWTRVANQSVPRMPTVTVASRTSETRLCGCIIRMEICTHMNQQDTRFTSSPKKEDIIQQEG